MLSCQRETKCACGARTLHDQLELESQRERWRSKIQVDGMNERKEGNDGNKKELERRSCTWRIG